MMSSASVFRPLSIILWIASFLSSLYFINDWQLSFFTASVFLFCLWAWVTLSERAAQGWQIARSPVLMFAGAFWIISFLSIFWSVMPLVSLSAFCFFSALPLSLLVFVMCPDEKRLITIGYILAVIMGGLATWAIIQYMIGFDRFYGQAFHPLADPSSLGALFNLGFIPALGWMVMTKSRPQALMAFLLAALLFAAMLATNARGPVIALIPAFLLFAGLGWRFVSGRRYMMAGVLALCAVFFVVSAHPNIVHAPAQAERITDTLTLANPDVTNNRNHIWEGAKGIVRDHWLMGTGFGTFFLYYPEYRVPDEHIGASHAHSDPLQYWAELGIVGLLFFYAFLLATLVRTWKALARVKQDDPLRMVILAPFCALGAVVIQAHVSFAFHNLAILLGAGFLLAVWFIATARVLDDELVPVQFPPDTGNVLHRAMLALPFVPVLFLFGSYMASEHYVNAARDSLFREQDLFKFASYLERAHSLDHGLNFRTWLLAANIPLGVLQDKYNTLDETQRKELYDQAAGQLARVLALNPRSASALYYQARLQDMGPVEWAEGMPSQEELYKEALRLSPLHLGARMALATLYEQQRDEDRMMDILKAGFDYKYSTPKAMDYYGRVMIMALARGNHDLHQQAMNKMVQFKRRMDTSFEMQRERAGRITASPVGQDNVIQ